MIEQVQQHVAEAYALTCGGGIVFGLAIQDVNLYLQAGAFLVAMISGCCAAYYYLKKARGP